MKRVILFLVLASMGCQANAWSLKDFASIATETVKSNPNKVSNNANINSLTNTEMNSGLKTALNQGVEKAVSSLGVANGFFGNPDVKIPLPNSLKKIERGLKLIGMGDQTDALILKMNRAAEDAAPQAKTLLIDSVKQMSLADAKAILTGPEDAATQYLKRTTSSKMAKKFLPIVKNATSKVQLAQTYNQYAALGSQFGVVNQEDANIEQYVTNKALDGLYLMIAKEEAAIRKDPIGQASNILKKVFGAVAK